ncbi:uncharacterized protein TNCV_4707371 [Trichonephila clavipes]|nr:uncharacterized protein TNCV_4707371 [Trichonephila clavipes]
MLRWSARRVARQLGHTDCVVREVLGPVDPRDAIYMKDRLRTPSTDQSSRRSPHCKKCTGTANYFIGPRPDTGSTFTRVLACLLRKHTKGAWLKDIWHHGAH